LLLMSALNQAEMNPGNWAQSMGKGTCCTWASEVRAGGRAPSNIARTRSGAGKVRQMTRVAK